MMGENRGFGFDPDDIDRVIREAGEGLRDAFDRLGQFFTAPAGPATAGEVGDGVWAIYTVGDDGGAHVEQVYATEIDALRANRHNIDSNRRVRFLPYGIAVSVLDDGEEAT